MTRAPLVERKRVLVLMPSWVGDITMATPLLRALRAALPAARLAVLVRPGLGVLLDGAPWIDERFESPMRGAAGPWTGLGGARAFNADAVLLLPNSLRSGLAGLRLARERIGYATQMRGWTLTHRVAAPSRREPRSAVDAYATLGEAALGCPIADRRVELFVTSVERSASDALLGSCRRLLVVNPGANRVDKRWPADRFALAASAIASAHDLDIAVTGGPSERGLVDSVIAALTSARFSSRAINLVEHGVTLGSLKAVLQRAVLLLTNDTGPRHMAAALGTPSVVLFGPTDHRWTTLAPDSARSSDRLLVAEPFLPETLSADTVRDVCRIDRISVGDVISAASAIIGGTARPTAHAR